MLDVGESRLNGRRWLDDVMLDRDWFFPTERTARASACLTLQPPLTLFLQLGQSRRASSSRFFGPRHSPLRYAPSR